MTLVPASLLLCVMSWMLQCHQWFWKESESSLKSPTYRLDCHFCQTCPSNMAKRCRRPTKILFFFSSHVLVYYCSSNLHSHQNNSTDILMLWKAGDYFYDSYRIGVPCGIKYRCSHALVEHRENLKLCSEILWDCMPFQTYSEKKPELQN